jgi:dihydrofolate reductase
MRKLIVLTFISIDGIMQAPGSPQEDTDLGFKYGGWVVPFFEERLGDIMDEQLAKPSDLLLGRKTYDIFASYWPTHASDWQGINSATKYVVSETYTTPTWENTVVINGNVVDQVRWLKQQSGPDIQVHGSSQLLQTLLAYDLVDELWLKIFPVMLGVGKRLFSDGALPAAFKLTHSEATPAGVIIAYYERAGAVKTGIFGD